MWVNFSDFDRPSRSVCKADLRIQLKVELLMAPASLAPVMAGL
jgi:hypothetical protein